MTATTTRTRIAAIGVVFVAVFVVVAAHLWSIMVVDHATWSRRSQQNRWAFHEVPGKRGAILDRHGVTLAADEATMELSVLYVRFRLRHPVGAAVHGATKWASCLPDRDGTTYDYGDGELGAEGAARALLAMPAAALRSRMLPKDVGNELRGVLTTVLATCSGQTRSRVFAALRAASRAAEPVAVGDVLDVPREQLLAEFARRLGALRELDRGLQALEQQRLGRPLGPDDPPGLMATLETLRRQSLAGERVTWWDDVSAAEAAAGGLETRPVEAAGGSDPDAVKAEDRVMAKRIGSKKEDLRAVFARDVPFDVAAELRVSAREFAGLDVAPMLARRQQAAEGTALGALLGVVDRIDRAVPGEEWLDAAVRARLPDDWLDDADLPEELVDDGGRTQLVEAAERRYRDALRRRERRGLSGVEFEFNGTLMGSFGLRFAEHDSRRREQQMLDHVRVESGDDVRLTLDLGLQRVAEAATHRARRAQLFGGELDHIRTEAALAVLDARTGDVLAYAGSPVSSPSARNLPGIEWIHDGSVGSVAKPFVLVEQLKAEEMAWPHRPLAGFEACNGRNCGRHAHWDGGKDPVEALAESCNSFYYQAGLGLGEQGVARALRRFGLSPASADDPYAACWQPRIRGIPAPAPARDTEQTALPQQSVGYGLQAAPLHVARAYAGLATGWLPTVGLVPGARPRVPLDDVVGAIALTERGLRACVQNGTARKLRLMNELGACGKTGTAEVGKRGENNAWFAGYLPPLGADGVQLCFCAVVYWVQDEVHGSEAAGELVVDFLEGIQRDDVLQRRYLQEGGR